jgi:tetratricopeptide (TPR) repeat protein
MRCPFLWGIPVLLFAAAAVSAQAPSSNPNGQTPSATSPGTSAQPAEAGQARTAPPDNKPEVIVTAPRDEQPLPALRPDEFRNCMGMVGVESIDYQQATLCEHQLAGEKRIVIEACINHDGKTALPRVIQACTECLDQKIFEGNARFFLLADRAAAYFAQGDKQHALDDYNEAVRLAPHNAYLHYNRGVFYAAQSDEEAALRDFDAAIGINADLVPALRQRAKVYLAHGNFTDARQDYSKAIGLQPKTAALWSERGYVSLRQQDYESAAKDEAEAIRLDPKLARAYYLRGAAAAFGGLGDAGSAVNDIKTAVNLDPALAAYVRITGKTVSLSLPPL